MSLTSRWIAAAVLVCLLKPTALAADDDAPPLMEKTGRFELEEGKLIVRAAVKLQANGRMHFTVESSGFEERIPVVM
jgi:hypothetical protein